jgi:predicted KAP-like P-loop ATPase
MKSLSKFMKESLDIPAMSEAEIKDADAFKEYAEKILKNAFGSEFDADKAKDVIDGLIGKYKDDYGAMVGALQASLD